MNRFNAAVTLDDEDAILPETMTTGAYLTDDTILRHTKLFPVPLGP